MKKIVLIIMSIMVMSSGVYAKSNINKEQKKINMTGEYSNIFPMSESYKIQGMDIVYQLNAIYLNNFRIGKFHFLGDKKIKKADLANFIAIVNKNNIPFEKFLKIKGFLFTKKEIGSSKNKKIILNALNIKNTKELYNKFENSDFKYTFAANVYLKSSFHGFVIPRLMARFSYPTPEILSP